MQINIASSIHRTLSAYVSSKILKGTTQTLFDGCISLVENLLLLLLLYRSCLFVSFCREKEWQSPPCVSKLLIQRFETILRGNGLQITAKQGIELQRTPVRISLQYKVNLSLLMTSLIF